MATERPTGVLFDIDGTLVDTTYLHTVSWWEALRQTDQPVPMATVHRSIGMGSDKLLDHLLGPERDRDADPKLRDAHDTLYAEYWERLTPLPGASDLLRACAERGLQVVLATSAAEHEVGALRRALNADDVIDTITSSADAEQEQAAPRTSWWPPWSSPGWPPTGSCSSATRSGTSRRPASWTSRAWG